MSTLEISHAGQTWRFTDQAVVVGRDASCDVVIGSPLVSRHHLRLEPTGPDWLLVDSSTGGTWEGSVRLTRTEVGAGKTVRLGTGTDAPLLRISASGAPQRPGGALVPGHAAHEATEVAGSELAVECSGRTHRLRPGQDYRFGRADDNDIVSANPTVSRHHGVFRYAADGWVFEDLGSARGSHLDGRADTRFRLGGINVLMLGDRDAGERVVTSGSGERQRTPGGRLRAATGRRRGLVAAIAAVLVLALVGGGGWLLLSNRTSSPDLERLARGTVHVITSTGSGSGTILDAQQGLILTNAHVAAPQASGLAVRYESLDSELGKEPTTIQIAVSEGMDRDALPRFRAEVAAADGYLDLAVLRIVRTEDNGNLAQALAGLTQIETGRSADVKTGQQIWAVGYPGAAQTNSPTYTQGIVSGVRNDPRLGGVLLLNSDVNINSGNSGGLATDAAGRIIGVPTRVDRLQTGPGLSGLVPIDLAKPLLDAARSGTAYTSPWSVPAPQAEVSEVTISLPVANEPVVGSCAGGRRLGPGADAMSVLVNYTGLPADAKHQDLLVRVIDIANSTAIGQQLSANSYPLRLPESGCVAVTLPLRTPLRAGVRYGLQVGLGGTHKTVSTATFTLS